MCLTDFVEERIANINEFFTFSLYSNVCRSLFEKHKLMFAFLLCARIMMNENKIDMVSIESFQSLFPRAKLMITWMISALCLTG